MTAALSRCCVSTTRKTNVEADRFDHAVIGATLVVSASEMRDGRMMLPEVSWRNDATDPAVLVAPRGEVLCDVTSQQERFCATRTHVGADTDLRGYALSRWCGRANAASYNFAYAPLRIRNPPRTQMV